jgi:hypothetical protein
MAGGVGAVKKMDTCWASVLCPFVCIYVGSNSAFKANCNQKNVFMSMKYGDKEM